MPCCRFIEFAPVIVIVATDLGTPVIDGAQASFAKVFTAPVNQQVPAAAVLVDLDAGVGNLPEQMIEISLRSRCSDRLGRVGAAGRLEAARALVSRIEWHYSQRVCVCDDAFVVYRESLSRQRRYCVSLLAGAAFDVRF